MNKQREILQRILSFISISVILIISIIGVFKLRRDPNANHILSSVFGPLFGPIVVSASSQIPLEDNQAEKGFQPADIEQTLLQRGIILSLNPNTRQAIRQKIKEEPAYTILADEILEILDGHRMINVLGLDEVDNILRHEYPTNKNSGYVDNLKNPMVVKDAMLKAWNDTYSQEQQALFSNISIPGGIVDLDDASQYGVRLLSHPIILVSGDVATVQMINPYLIELKNMLKITLNTHGYTLPDGENAYIAFQQPGYGGWHEAILSIYADPSSKGDQIAYIPLTSFNLPDGPLSLTTPSGYLQVYILGQGKYHVEIKDISAFYLGNN